MKKLSEIIESIKPEQTLNFKEATIGSLRYLAEDARHDTLFCFVDEFLKYGRWLEGKTQQEEVAAKQVAAFLTDTPVETIDCPQLIVKDPVKSMAAAARCIEDHPDKKMEIIGVTGTNGKTTTAHLISGLLNSTGIESACLGTIGIYGKSGKKKESIYTTPLSPELYATLGELAAEGIKTTAMEISSHSLKLDRVHGLDVDAAIFTNLTRDHLDFHETVEDYCASKEKLFTMLKSTGIAAINFDDEYGKKFAKISNGNVITYGMEDGCDVAALDASYFPDSTTFTLKYKDKSVKIKTRLTGKFNIYNILASAAVCIGRGMDPESLVAGIEAFKSVPGRMEVLRLPGGVTAIVDYAHTPDALENVLTTIRETAKQRIITVFGCGGDRDRGKRPIMGKTACSLSDICIVTADNPRTENPGQILSDILTGIERKDPIVELDREKAIYKALEISNEGDIVLVAGKGHEDYQIIGTEKFHFSDQEVLLCSKSMDILKR